MLFLELDAHQVFGFDTTGNGTEFVDILGSGPEYLVAHAFFGPFHDFRKVEDGYLLVTSEI